MNAGHYAKRGIRYLKKNGFARFAAKVTYKMRSDAADKDYVPVKASSEELAKQRKHVFEHPYKFSILVPVYETDPKLLRAMLESVGDQTYGNWELILADASHDDSRRGVVRSFIQEYNMKCRDTFGSIFDKVIYIKTPEKTGISANTNEALDKSSGDYIALLDHDDLLEKTALFDIMSAIEEKCEKARRAESIAKIMAIYTDEDKVNEEGDRFFQPHFKCGFDPVLLCTNNYICHFFVADAALAKSVSGFRPEYDGAQDHDFILRCTEDLTHDQVLHVPKVLYHWRSTSGSTAENPDAKLYAYEAGKRAVEDRFKRAGIKVRVTDSPHLGFYEIKYEKLHKKVKIFTAEEFAAMNETERSNVDAEFIMILSDRLIPQSADYTEMMMSCMHIANIGAVTGRIIGKDKKIESAGFDLDREGNAAARFAGLSRFYDGYMHRAALDQLVDAFSPDCVLVRTSAVKTFYPKIELKDRFDIYYMHRAEFRRKSK